MMGNTIIIKNEVGDILYEGPEQRMNELNHQSSSDLPTVRVWHFIASQIVLFISIATFAFVFGSWTIGQLQTNFYPTAKGTLLENAVDKLNVNLEKQNTILTELRIFIATNVKTVK